MTAGEARVLGVRVDCLEREDLLARAVAWGQGETARTILYVNAYCLNIASEDADYHRILNAADLVYPDGVGAVWAARATSGARAHKITGADWIDAFCERAEAEGLRLFILAGKPGVARDACERLSRRYPRLQIAGAADGFFQELGEADTLRAIQEAQPDVLFVGMGTPRQEKWIAARRGELPARVVWAVGALFDYVAGVEPRAPGWMKALALEWLWRLMMDPGGKWRRYILGNPLFVWRVLKSRG